MRAETIRGRKQLAAEVAARDAARVARETADLPKVSRGRNSTEPPPLRQKGSGLATWRHRQAEDKREQMAELERLREDAVTVERDGQEFRVVRIPGFTGRAPLPPRQSIPVEERERRRIGRHSFPTEGQAP